MSNGVNSFSPNKLSSLAAAAYAEASVKTSHLSGVTPNRTTQEAFAESSVATDVISNSYVNVVHSVLATINIVERVSGKIALQQKIRDSLVPNSLCK